MVSDFKESDVARPHPMSGPAFRQAMGEALWMPQLTTPTRTRQSGSFAAPYAWSWARCMVVKSRE